MAIAFGHLAEMPALAGPGQVAQAAAFGSGPIPDCSRPSEALTAIDPALCRGPVLPSIGVSSAGGGPRKRGPKFDALGTCSGPLPVSR